VIKDLLLPTPRELGAVPWRRPGLGSGAIGDGSVMSEPTSHTEEAGAGISDEEMVETVAEQTDSASENADTAGKDWNGDPSGEHG
jgi:aspartate oxidase